MRVRRLANVFASAVVLLLLASVAPAAASEEWVPISPVVSLAETRTWDLQGEKLKGGGCRYVDEEEVQEIPEEGWARITIAVDPTKCRKRMQEGTPTDSNEFRKAAGIDAAPEQSLLASRRGAWQAVLFYDIANLHLTTQSTQIYWTYNGSTVSNGTTTAGCVRNYTWWTIDYCTPSQSYPAGTYRGQSVARFHSNFCVGLPTTYIYQYYNRVWGHPNGTATRSQSSDSNDECIILHSAVFAGYN